MKLKLVALGAGNFPGGGGFGANLQPSETPGPGFRGGFGGTLALAGTVVEVTADHLILELASG